jgi:hypothetical protein
MKRFNPLYTLSLALIFMCSLGLMVSVGCAPSKAVAAKSGVQLWSENCQRCHNTPSPITFSSEQWETIGMHMQTRALITQAEREKIVDFLKSNK